MSQLLPIAPCGHIAASELTATFWADEDCIYYQVKIKGFCVSRRDDNHMINGTKLLNVATTSRSRRDWILRNEPIKNVVKKGPMHLMGIWIPFERAWVLANQSNITGFLYPLFVNDLRALLHHPIDQIPQQVKPNIFGKIQYRRSRSGCFTCRLRGKKCDEGQQRCMHCRQLGLQCEYQKPQWWKDMSLRKLQKAHISSIIGRAPPLLCSLGCDLNQQATYDQINNWSKLQSSPYKVDTHYQAFLPPPSDFQTHVSDTPTSNVSIYPPLGVADVKSSMEEWA